MPDQLTSTGLTIKTLDERTDDIISDMHANISPNIDFSVPQADGQIVRILSEKIQQVAELVQEVHTAFDPNQATGNLLSMLCTLTGSSRRAATKGTVTLTLNLDAATTVLAGALFQVSGEPENRWATDVDVTSVGAGNYNVAATHITAGAFQALAATITVIVNPQAGLNSCTNSADAQVGLDEETDTELRLRREQEAFLPGSADVTAIQAQLSAIDEIISVVVYENTSIQSLLGMPPKSIQAIIWDGSPPAADNAEIAETLFEQTSAGIQKYGTTVVTHTDTEGNDHQIGFTRATVVYILCDITLTAGTDYVGDAVVQTTINTYIETTLGTGGDVLRADIVQVVNELDGVDNIDLTLLKLSRKPAPTAAADITIDRDEKAMVETLAADITVTS
jgi:uncharacterized phage protein gp47/JayE